MARSIPAVAEGISHIRQCLLIDLTLDTTTYYISNAYKALTYDGNNYTELGGFLSMGAIQEDIKTTNGDLQINLTGIPSGNITAVLNAPVKGGNVTVHRAFLTDNYEIQSANVYQRFNGIITNFSVNEDQDIIKGERTHSVSVTCASIVTILENKVAGQRTSPTDRDKFYSGDLTFYRVPELQDTQFDFGREFTGTGYGGGGGPGGPGGPGDNFPRFPR